ncbi:MAG: CPBP family intramembrane metalloprotease [Acidobacteria bacterium]|nr:CPBP family intramembrane metalloprotease [Acidobacteriota bacterium]
MPRIYRWVEGLSPSFTVQDLVIPWAMLPTSIATLALAWWAFRKVGLPVPLPGQLGRSSKGTVPAAGITAAAALAAWLGMIALGSVTVTRNPEFTWVALVTSIPWVLFQSASEELWARGLYLGVLHGPFGDAWANWIQAIGFGALHFISAAGLRGTAGPGYWLLGISTTLLGLICGWATLRWGNLWAPIAIHFVWNWVSSTLTGLPCSGSIPMPGPFLSKDVGYTRWLHGGVIGVEGSVLGVTVFLAMALWISRWPLSQATESN